MVVGVETDPVCSLTLAGSELRLALWHEDRLQWENRLPADQVQRLDDATKAHRASEGGIYSPPDGSPRRWRHLRAGRVAELQAILTATP